MGLSASQARLLSITSRLSDNELRSQTITTAKTSLANETTAASTAYMDALNSTELLYTTYDGGGNKVTEKLTGTSLSQYGELKNQYGIINQHGQILVSELDATNYETSSDMYDFLDKYGVLAPESEWDTIQVENPQWQIDWDKYNQDYADWLLKKPDRSDEKYWEEVSGVNTELYQKFKEASASCYSNAMMGAAGSLDETMSSRCYKHVLAHLLMSEFPEGGSKKYQTITGNNIDIGWDFINGSAINKTGKTPDMIPVSEAVCDTSDIIYCAENEGMKQELLDTMNDPTVDQKRKDAVSLMSNYYIDANGDAQLKTLKQKCIDLYYLLTYYKDFGLDYYNDCQPILATFQADMEYAFTENVFKKDLYDGEYNAWLADEPDKPETPYYIDEAVPTIENKDKGQWYINLWHRMNGPSEEKAGTVLEDGTVVEGGKTTGGRPLYKVLEDGLMDNPEWLQSALANGTVTLEQVQFVEETEVGTGLADCEWTSIIWTNAADITESQNETAITLAEIKYEQALNDIEAKDKQFDNQLKILDTEHNALQTEYDSIKSIIEKTIERNLKLYS